MNMFSEMDLKRLIIRLVDLFAQLQRANIAHRNIKPANLVFSSANKQASGRSKAPQFEDLIVCNFEIATCFPVNMAVKDMICS